MADQNLLSRAPPRFERRAFLGTACKCSRYQWFIVLIHWYRLHLQSFVPTPVLRRVDVKQAADHENNSRI
jgi:hypothetical protein